MACDCDCQMLKTIRYLIKKNQELEERVVRLEDKDFVSMIARRPIYDEECDCGCSGKK